MSTPRLFGIFGAVALMGSSAVFFASACSGDGAPPATDGAPGAGGDPAGGEYPRDSLVIASASDANNMIYIVAESHNDSMIISNTNLTLLNNDFDCGLKWTPMLAKTYTWSEDGSVLKFELDPSYTWQDGTPVTAHDIKFTYDLIRDPVVASPRLAYLDHMVEGKSPLVTGDHSLEFHFSKQYDRNSMIAHVGMPPVPKHLVEGLDRATLRGSDFNRNPVINGRWKIDKWDRDQQMVLTPNDKFTGPPDQMPKLKRVIFRILPEYATRLVELETGNVDLMEAVQVADADRLAKEHPEIKLVRKGWRSMDYIAYNRLDAADYKDKKAGVGQGQELDWDTVEPHHIFGDKDVRRALGKAIHVDKLINDLLTSQTTGEKYGRPAVSTVTPALCGVHNDDIKRLPYDPTAAKAELAALGWTDTDGDGWLDKDGKPLRFTLLTNSGNPRRAKASVIIQANLKEAGVDVQLESVEANNFFERLRKKDYEAALSGWAAGLFVDPTEIWSSGDRHEFNFVAYSNPEVDALIERGMAEPDPVKAGPIWQEFQQKVYDDQPYTFLYWMDEIIAVNGRFEDTTVDVLSSYRNIHEWWVPNDKVKYQH